MKEIRKSSQFKKDFKRIRNDNDKVEALLNIVRLLERGEGIPDKYSPHMLKGRLKGIMECHIGPDYLLLWLDEEKNIVRLIRHGSHAEIFGM